MYSTTVYLYQQITRVLLVNTDGGYFTARYDPVYAKSLTINKGVDNVLLFEFINQDQKPVNITGSTFVFRVINQTGDELLVQKNCEVLSATTGRVKVVLDTNDTINLQAQPASYSIERSAGNYVQAVYVDANSQARADCNIVDSILPQFQPSQPVTVPDLYGKNQFVGTAPTSYPDWALNPQPINSIQPTEFYSSQIETTGAAFTTVKFDLVHFDLTAGAYELNKEVFEQLAANNLSDDGIIVFDDMTPRHPKMLLFFQYLITKTEFRPIAFSTGKIALMRRGHKQAFIDKALAAGLIDPDDERSYYYAFLVEGHPDSDWGDFLNLRAN